MIYTNMLINFLNRAYALANENVDYKKTLYTLITMGLDNHVLVNSETARELNAIVDSIKTLCAKGNYAVCVDLKFGPHSREIQPAIVREHVKTLILEGVDCAHIFDYVNANFYAYTVKALESNELFPTLTINNNFCERLDTLKAELLLKLEKGMYLYVEDESVPVYQAMLPQFSNRFRPISVASI